MSEQRSNNPSCLLFLFLILGILCLLVLYNNLDKFFKNVENAIIILNDYKIQLSEINESLKGIKQNLEEIRKGHKIISLKEFDGTLKFTEDDELSKK